VQGGFDVVIGNLLWGVEFKQEDEKKSIVVYWLVMIIAVVKVRAGFLPLTKLLPITLENSSKNL
jgi:hypothetical protein